MLRFSQVAEVPIEVTTKFENGLKTDLPRALRVQGLDQ